MVSGVPEGRLFGLPRRVTRRPLGAPPFAPVFGIRRRNRRRQQSGPIESQARILGLDRPANFFGKWLAANFDLRRRAKPEQDARTRRFASAARARLDDREVLVAPLVARKLQEGHGAAIFACAPEQVCWASWLSWRFSPAWLS